MPGCLVWLILAGVFVWTGEWINSIGRARNHPVLIAILAVALVAAAAWGARRSERWLPGFLVMLLLNIVSSGLLILFVFAIDSLPGYPFTAFGRSFLLGRLVVVTLPILFVLLIVCTTVFGLIYAIIDAIRRR